MRFLLIFLLISTTAFAKDKIYTCKPIAAAAVTKSGQIYSETLADMDEEAGLLSVVPESQFLISKEEGFFYKNNLHRDFEALTMFENLDNYEKILDIEKVSQELDKTLNIKPLKVFYLPYRNYTKEGKLQGSSIKRITINVDKNFTSEITIPIDMKDISMYHFLRKCEGDDDKDSIQVDFEPGPNKALS
tara:strand:- start:907 stop:1473 length:567 start_codon:yes stop_codon:yes gene_type:complete